MSFNSDMEKPKSSSTEKERQEVEVSDMEVGSTADQTTTDAEKAQATDEDVFKVDPDGNGPDLRGVSVFGAVCLIIKSSFGLGVLGLPYSLHTLGFVPGLISLTVISIISTMTGLYIGKFRLAHPNVHSVGDAAELLFGRVGQELLGAAFWLFYLLSFASAILTVSIALNSFTDGQYCTLIWVGVGAIVSLFLGVFTRTLKVLSWMSYSAVVSIVIAVWITAIACLAQDRPAAAPVGEPIQKDVRAFAKISFAAAASAIAAQAFSMASTASYFTIHAEMRNQRDWSKAFLIAQAFVVFNYFAISCIIYGKVGQYIASPALGSAGQLWKKVSYGVGFPALIFTAFFQAHVAGKYVMVRVLRGTRHLQSNTATHWSVWSGNIIVVCAIGFVIACAIPFFSDLIGLTGALLGTIFQMMMPAAMYLYEARPEGTPTSRGRWIPATLMAKGRKPKQAAMVWLSVVGFLIGLFIAIGGTYGSIASIADGYASGAIGSAFSCADNSASS